MSLRSGAVDYQAPLLRQSEERSARWLLVGQGGAMYRFERPARNRRLRSRVLYLVCGLLILLAAAFIVSSALYVRDWLQGLFLLLALTG
jgi:hypothetical protein